MVPMSPAGTSLPDSSSTCTFHPGTGFVGDPGFTGIGSMPIGLAAIGQPVSVCHQ